MSNLEAKFADVYRLNMNTRVDRKKMSTLVFKYGQSQLLYTLGRLKDSTIRSEDYRHPYDHLDLVCGRMLDKYKKKSKLAPGTTMNFSSKRRRGVTKRF